MVTPGGYAWWYVDALSTDGRRGLTIIAFLGSVFSPYYAWARRRDPYADPLQHAAVNVALYGDDGRRWTMTERGAARVQRDATTLAIGPSRLEWRDGALTIDIDERSAPWGQTVRGRIRVVPERVYDERFELDVAGRHVWLPIAPCARVEVDLAQPASRWSGHAYLDANRGAAPLEADFRRWHWSRAHGGDGSTTVLYDVERRDASRFGLALRFTPASAKAEPVGAPPIAPLPPSRWRIERATRSDAGKPPRLVKSLEDGPFYARSLVECTLAGEPALAMHESLDLSRFALSWVQAMLPFRMPRRA